MLKEFFVPVNKHCCYVSMVIGEGVGCASLSPLGQKKYFETVKVVDVQERSEFSAPGQRLKPIWPVWLSELPGEPGSLTGFVHAGEGRERQDFQSSVAMLDPFAECTKSAVQAWQVMRFLSSYSVAVLVFPPAFGHEWHCEVA